MQVHSTAELHAACCVERTKGRRLSPSKSCVKLVAPALAAAARRAAHVINGAMALGTGCVRAAPHRLRRSALLTDGHAVRNRGPSSVILGSEARPCTSCVALSSLCVTLSMLVRFE